jgi:hypothetical protein
VAGDQQVAHDRLVDPVAEAVVRRAVEHAQAGRLEHRGELVAARDAGVPGELEALVLEPGLDEGGVGVEIAAV